MNAKKLIVQRERLSGWMDESTKHLTLTWETAICLLIVNVGLFYPWPWSFPNLSTAYYCNHDDIDLLTLNKLVILTQVQVTLFVPIGRTGLQYKRDH